MMIETGTMIGFAPPPTGPDGAAQSPGWASFVPMILMLGVFYFVLIRPQMKAKKAQEAMIEAIKTGDDIITTGGILGTVANVKDKTVIVKVADNVKLEILKAHVAQVTKVEKKS